MRQNRPRRARLAGGFTVARTSTFVSRFRLADLTRQVSRAFALFPFILATKLYLLLWYQWIVGRDPLSAVSTVPMRHGAPPSHRTWPALAT